MIRTIAVLIALGSPASAGRPAVQVESPDGRTAVEAAAVGPEKLARRCEAMGREYERRPTPEGVDELFFCLGHSDGRTRSMTLDALAEWKTIDRPDFARAFYPRLKKAVELYSRDPDFEVRYSAGFLPRMLEHWYNFKSPAAAERRMRFYNGHPPREAPAWLGGLALLVSFLFAVYVAVQAAKRR
jgi:hypothetical protein